MLENIIIDQYLQDKIDSKALTVSDHLLLALADFTATLFPAFTTYVGAQQQGVEPAAVWIDYYNVSSQKRLDGAKCFDFGVEITYWPKNPLSSAELTNAIYMIEENLNVLHSDIGQFLCYSTSADITDGIAHIIANITAQVEEVECGPFIKIATKEVKYFD